MRSKTSVWARRRRRGGPLLLAALAATVGATAVGGCGDDSSDSPSPDPVTPDEPKVELSDDAVIEYHFQDSSVPPEFHRSYTLTITS